MVQESSKERLVRILSDKGFAPGLVPPVLDLYKGKFEAEAIDVLQIAAQQRTLTPMYIVIKMLKSHHENHIQKGCLKPASTEETLLMFKNIREHTLHINKFQPQPA